MAIDVVFGNGKVAWEAGSYHEFRSGVTNPPISNDYGKLLIINTGNLGEGFGFGSGINGELKSGKDAFVQNIKRPEDLRNLVKGGILYDLAYSLFKPENGVNGVSSITMINAGTTTASIITMALTNETILVNPLDEGTVGNGEVNDDDVLVKGYGVKMTADPVEADHYRFGFFVGKWRGVDGAGYEISTPKADLVDQDLIVETPAMATTTELVDWMKNNSVFKSMFRYESSTGDGGVITAGDLSGWGGAESDFVLASGGTESWDGDDLDAVMECLNDIDFSAILSDNYGEDAYGDVNIRIQYFLESEARFRSTLYVGGGADETEFSDSVGYAESFDSPRVVLCHGGNGVNDDTVIDNMRKMNGFYKACYVVGRVLGLPPQVPVTSKSIRIDQDLHKMRSDQRRQALDSGVLHTFFDTDYGKIVVNQGINTMQNNKSLIDSFTGASHSIAVERIYSQLQKDIVINSKKQLLGDPSGVNRNTLTSADVKTWTSVFLKTKIATKLNDNIILSYKDIEVVRNGDAYEITFKFEPNSEINKLIFFSVII